MRHWQTLSFGRYNGKTLPQIVLHDPDYFFWGLAQPIFKGRLADEASELAYKAKHISIPEAYSDGFIVAYFVDQHGRFARFEITRPSELIEGSYFTDDRLDLSVIRRLKHYDKTGNKLMLRSFKYYYFGNAGARLSRRKCEQFFNDDQNFCVAVHDRDENVVHEISTQI